MSQRGIFDDMSIHGITAIAFCCFSSIIRASRIVVINVLGEAVAKRFDFSHISLIAAVGTVM